jgi:hypothetical protein
LRQQHGWAEIGSGKSWLWMKTLSALSSAPGRVQAGRTQWMLALGVMLALAAPGYSPAAAETAWKAKWIWRNQKERNPYNQTVVARKRFRLEQTGPAALRLTADSFYRLFINGRWVNDGPCRSWPEHFQYDVIDATPYLARGDNELRIVARYYGVGDFHRVPKEAGLLAQLEVTPAGSKSVVIATDASWEIAEARAWVSNTPKVSIQMEPAELYDARLEGNLEFRKAAVLYDANQGPWKGLNPRDVALMTRQPFPFKSFVGAKAVKAVGLNYCLPAARLVNPGLIEANHTASLACGMAAILSATQECAVTAQAEGFVMTIDGRRGEQNQFRLAPGKHLALALVSEIFSHDKERSLRFMNPGGFRLENPLQPSHENPWCFLRFPGFAIATNDLRWLNFRHEDPNLARVMDGYARSSEQLLKSVKDLDSFQQQLGPRAEVMSSERMFVQDTAWQFQQRQVAGEASALVENPAGLIHDNPEATTVHPSSQGDVELLYDFGEQNCGYYEFELEAPAGVQVDLYGLEYIAPDGRLQHSWGNRNGLRYITKEGVNRFTSLKRRSGRYLFVTLRNQPSPVRIRHLRLVESTYPVNCLGSFSCSDARLDRIWDISTRTLKLCMEDTFTDCPLYEQTHWVGDARNESLLAYGVFGATDLAKRCVRLTAQSLDRLPFAGCQTPSGWDCLLPAWSFLWGISTWDYYWETGDEEFLREFYPAVIRNLKGAERFIDRRDLFSGPFWNLFDWAGIDQGQKAVLHNSMFMVGALDAALKAAEVLKDSAHVPWLRELRTRLVGGVNRLWDPACGAYPDSIRDDGSISPSTCQHTSFLAVLYE